MMSITLAQRKRDEVAEWLRRWTANPLGSARVGSNPILVEVFGILAENVRVHAKLG